jgi:hypothetical protein
MYQDEDFYSIHNFYIPSSGLEIKVQTFLYRLTFSHTPDSTAFANTMGIFRNVLKTTLLGEISVNEMKSNIKYKYQISKLYKM